jgi:hypothetical protein
MNADGPRRRQIQQTAPFAVQFVTDVTGAADPDDPLVIQTQLARLWTSLREQLPCIIIIDSSYQPRVSGLGGLEQGRRIPAPNGKDTETIIVQTIHATVGISLMIGANTESDASNLSDLLNYVLGPLTHFNRGHVISPGRPTDRWEVRLPLHYDMAGLERRNLGEDQRDSMWSTSINMEVQFEGEISHGMHHPADPFIRDLAGGDLYTRSSTLNVYAPSSISLRQHVPLRVENLPVSAYLITDDPRVAIVDDNLILHPKKPGTCKLLILRDSSSDPQPTKLWEQVLTVTPL